MEPNNRFASGALYQGMTSVVPQRRQKKEAGLSPCGCFFAIRTAKSTHIREAHPGILCDLRVLCGETVFYFPANNSIRSFRNTSLKSVPASGDEFGSACGTPVVGAPSSVVFTITRLPTPRAGSKNISDENPP